MRKSGFKALVAAGVVATGIAASTTVVAANDIFLKIGNIVGESQDFKHKGEIDVLAWSWGESNGTAQTRRGRVPVTCIQDLALTKKVDSSSPALIMMGVTGQVVPEAVMTMRKASDVKNPGEYFVLKMTNVMVSSYQTGGSAGNESSFVDSVVLHFDMLRGEYRPQKEDGSLGAPIIFEVSGSCQ